MERGLISAFKKGEELQKEIRTSKDKGRPDSFDIWWLGQSGFLLQWNGSCLLFDPYLSDSLTNKYAQTTKPHIRMGELVITPHLLDMIDVVTSSHNHTDHLDGETLIPLLKANPKITFLIPEANREFVAERVKCLRNFPLGITDGESLTAKNFEFHGIPAAHNNIDRDQSGRCLFMGYVVRFGSFSVYHSGDTLWFEGLEKLLKPFGVDVALLPINGNDPSRGVAGNLNVREAAELGKQIGARYVIPHHYNMFKFNTADPADFIREAQKLRQPFVVLEHGQKWTCTVL